MGLTSFPNKTEHIFCTVSPAWSVNKVVISFYKDMGSFCKLWYCVIWIRYSWPWRNKLIFVGQILIVPKIYETQSVIHRLLISYKYCLQTVTWYLYPQASYSVDSQTGLSFCLCPRSNSQVKTYFMVSYHWS